MKQYAITLIALCLSMQVFAHGGMAGDMPKTALDASAALSWRSEGAVDKKQAWRIPGVMTGGEAWPVEEGVAVDEVTLQLYHALNANWYGVLKAGTHGAGSDDHGGIQLEHAYVGWRCCEAANTVAVEAGKLMGMFSPGIAQHSSDRLFSESALALDAFLGRHFHDEGVRAVWMHQSGFSAGAEVWRGKAYPATAGNGGGSYDVFAKYQWHGEHLMLTVGAWAMQADADLRGDHRYMGNHDHNSAFVAQIPDVRFTGSSDLWGLHGAARWHINHHWALSVEGEWMQVEADGELFDGTRRADLVGEYAGGWLQAGVHWLNHSLSVRAEELVLKNQLSGSGAPQLLNDANLAGRGENPSRLSVGWHWQFLPSLAFRLEAVQDDSVLEERSRIVVGVVWSDRIWSRH